LSGYDWQRRSLVRWFWRHCSTSKSAHLFFLYAPNIPHHRSNKCLSTNFNWSCAYVILWTQNECATAFVQHVLLEETVHEPNSIYWIWVTPVWDTEAVSAKVVLIVTMEQFICHHKSGWGLAENWGSCYVHVLPFPYLSTGDSSLLQIDVWGPCAPEAKEKCQILTVLVTCKESSFMALYIAE